MLHSLCSLEQQHYLLTAKLQQSLYDGKKTMMWIIVGTMVEKNSRNKQTITEKERKKRWKNGFKCIYLFTEQVQWFSRCFTIRQYQTTKKYSWLAEHLSVLYKVPCEIEKPWTMKEEIRKKRTEEKTTFKTYTHTTNRKCSDGGKCMWFTTQSYWIGQK